jgi:hypothetical protein
MRIPYWGTRIMFVCSWRCSRGMLGFARRMRTLAVNLDADCDSFRLR